MVAHTLYYYPPVRLLNIVSSLTAVIGKQDRIKVTMHINANCNKKKEEKSTTTTTPTTTTARPPTTTTTRNYYC